MAIIKKAKISDTPKIKKIIDFYAGKQVMLFRPIYEIYGNIRDFFVVEEKKKIIGCCALHILGKEYRPGREESVLAEVRSLAVLQKHQNRGIGTMLIKACLKEASKMDINKIFTLTIKENVEFFKKLGFKEIKKSRLPQKIWQECVKCPRFPHNCNEVALILNI